MESFNFKSEDIINARERFNVPKKMEPPIDWIATDIVKQKVYSTDPRLIKVVVKHKKLKGNDESPDNFLKNPNFIKDLREAFNQPI